MNMMKNSILFLLFFVSLIGCRQAEKLTIHAPLYAGDTCLLTYANRMRHVVLDQEGKAEVEVTPYMDFCYLRFGKGMYVNFYAGEKGLNISVDDQKKVMFEGAHAEASYHLSATSYPQPGIPFGMLSKEEFEQKIKIYTDTLEQILVKANLSDKRFLKQQRKRFQLKAQPFNYGMDTLKFEDERFQTLTKEEKEWLSLDDYLYTLYRFPKDMLEAKHGLTRLPYEEMRDLVDYVIEKYKNKEVIQRVLYLVAIEYVSKQGNDPYLDKMYRKYVSDPYLLATYEELSRKWDGLWIGRPCQALTSTNRDGKPLDFNKYKGKYLMMDIWATWCGPCVKDQKILFAMEPEFKNDNIEFITLSCDKFRKKWLQYIEANNMMDDHHYNIQDNTALSKTYAIRTIPRFILIDPEGNLVCAAFPRSSFKEFKPLLKHILQRK